MAELSDIQALVVSQLRDLKPRDLLVSAGAGAGKTLVLVQSLLGALRAGIPLDRILVVTFTDKAAAQMRNRIYEELEKDEKLSSLRLRLPQAWISTIHSFCMRILHERFERAGVDPQFRVLPEEDARLLLEDAMSRVFHEEYEKRSEPFEELVDMCGFDAGGESLRGVVRALLAYARTSERPDEFLPTHASRLRHPAREWSELPWTQDYARRAVRAWRTAIGILRILTREMGDRKRFESLLAALDGCDATLLGEPSSQRTFRERLESLGIGKAGDPLAIAVPSLPRGMGEAFGKMKDEAASALKSPWLSEMPIDEGAVLADEGAASRLGLALISLTRRVSEAYAQAKDRSGRLDFEDLQVRALRLISAEAGSDQPIRFERVLIDEFQDVNRLQQEVLSRVCDPTGILRVGDIKQSIYQFRLADPSIIRALADGRPVVRDPASAPDEAAAWNVLLPCNYRSRPPILEVANRIARGLFLRSEIGTEYDEQKLVPGIPPDPTRDAPVEMLLIHENDRREEPDSDEIEGEAEEGDEEDRVRPDLRDSEWTAIARRIQELVESGILVRDPSTQKERPVGYSDIAILMRAHASAPALARRLEEEGIPSSLSTGESFFAAQEVRDLLNLLRITDNLLDDISLAAALRSPAFGWSDGELLALRLTLPAATHLAYSMAVLAGGGEVGPFADAILPGLPEERAILCGSRASLPDEPPFSTLPRRCADALTMILRWRERSGRSELPSLVARILDDTGLPRSVASLPGGLRRQTNLRKLIGIARRYVQDAGHNLHRFLRWCESLEERDAKILEAPVSSETVPAVRIATVHGAKGLEFPVVFVAEMGRRYPLGSRIKALVPGRDYIGVQLIDQKDYILRRPLPLRLLLDRGVDDDIAEEKRILYVALTRARDRLILSGVHSSRTIPPEPLLSMYRKAKLRGDEEGEAVTEHLLKRKPAPLAWALYSLPPLPHPHPSESSREVEGLPLLVRWIAASAREDGAPSPNPIRTMEDRLRDLAPVEVPGGPAAEGEEAVARSGKRPPFPSPGALETARGKLWATEFKSGRDLVHRIPRNAPEAGETDEGATSLVAEATVPKGATSSPGGGGDAATAAAEGIEIHALLERLDFAGLDTGNLSGRIEEAAARAGVTSPAPVDTVRRGLPALLAHPVGETISRVAELHREVSFSIRIPFLEITRWLPDLREEMLQSEEWKEWISAGSGPGEGPIRIRPDKPAGADAHWVLVQGRIDAVMREGDGWRILDWKSDRVPGDGPPLEARVDLYRGQMGIYRRAVESLFGTPVRATLFFLRPGVIIDV